MNNAEIEQLKLLVEEKYGKGLNTTTDFESFSVDLHYKAQLDLSASTLKRLWGYVSDSHKPRVGTLDVLARYLGHADYRAFVRWLKTSTRFNSSFIHADQLVSNALVVGDEVEIGWNPNRLIRLRYLAKVSMRSLPLTTASYAWATAFSRDASSKDSLSSCPICSARASVLSPSWQGAMADFQF